MKRVGVYYEGVVENAKKVLERHNLLTITTYRTRTSFKPASVKRQRAEQKETVVSPTVYK